MPSGEFLLRVARFRARGEEQGFCMNIQHSYLQV